MTTHQFSRRTFLAGTAATAGIAALGLSGCGSNNSGSSNSSSSSKEKATTITAAPAYTSTNCNPIGNSSALMLAATWHVFEGLYDLDLSNYKTYNGLADGEPTKVSDTEYTVKLRSGALFSDGTEVTAKDVVNAFEKNMADDTYGPFLSFIESVSAKDDTTVDFKLKYAFESLLKGRLSVVKVFPASLSDNDLKTKPIGSGPWMYDTINGDDGGTITFVPNPHYNGTKPANNDKMEWNILLDNTSRTTAATSGTALAIENVPDANADQIAKSIEVEYVPGFALPFLMFNTKKAPFDNKKVRQAFFYAIDVDKLISNQMANHAKAATSFLPESYENYHKASTVFSYDPEKAKSLLQEAGQTSITCELMVNNNWVKNLAAQIKENLAAVGIDVTINETKIDWASLAPSDSILPYDVMLTPGDPSCFGNDPDLLMNWWYGDNVWTKGRSCWNSTSEWAELQTLLQNARQESDKSKQQSIWNDCFDIIAENCPIYPLFHRETGTAYDDKKLEGFTPIGTTGLVFLGATAYK